MRGSPRPTAQSVVRTSSVVRAPATMTSTARLPEHEPSGRSGREALTGELDTRLRIDEVRDERPPVLEDEASVDDLQAVERDSVGNRVAEVRSPVDGDVEELGREQRVAGQARSGAGRGLEVELRDARIVRKALVDPRRLEPVREHGVLRARRPSAPRRSPPSRRRPRRRQWERRDGAAAAGAPLRRVVRRRTRRATGAPRGARPGRLALEPDPERAGNGVDAGLVRELPERENRGESDCQDDADRGRDERPREAVSEPRDEHDEPERDEVEGVAVVEPVVRVGRAVEGGDDEEPDGVGRRKSAANAAAGRSRPDRCGAGSRGRSARPPAVSRRGRSRSRRGGRRATWPPRQRVVAAPELPVRSERLAGELPERTRPARTTTASTIGTRSARAARDRSRPRSARRQNPPDEREPGEPGHVQRAELGTRRECGGNRGEQRELAPDATVSRARA